MLKGADVYLRSLSITVQFWVRHKLVAAETLVFVHIQLWFVKPQTELGNISKMHFS